MAQEVDFDQEFPLSQAELNAPLIGENGELPSDYEDFAPYEEPRVPQAGNSPEVEAEFERFYQENATAIMEEEVQEPVYAEPTQGLGYVPSSTSNQQGQAAVKIPQNAKSISVKDLPKTSDAQNAQAQSQANNEVVNQQLDGLEKSIERMELSIESIIEKGLGPQSGSGNAGERQAKSINDVPDLTTITSQDVASVGLLNAERGYRQDIFQTTSVSDMRSLFSKIKQNPIQSYVLRKEFIKILTSQAGTPPTVRNIQTNNWLTQRLKMLQNMGQYRQSNLILSKAGIQATNVNEFLGLPEVWVSSKLLQGDVNETCPFVKNNILNADSPFWRKALLTCQLLTGDEKGLSLSLNMVNQKSRQADPLLYNLLDAAQGNAETPLLRPGQNLSALHASIYNYAPDLITPAVVSHLPDVALRKVAKNVALNIPLRIQAAEELVEKYDFMDDLALLGLLYDKAEFDPKAVASAGVERIAEAEVNSSVARALLWQGAKASGLPSTRALTLKALWQRAYKDKLFRLAAKLKPELRGIQSNSNLAWLAPQVVQQSLFVGDVEHAKKWWEPLKRNRSLSKELSNKRGKVAILMSFAEGKLLEGDFQAWLKNLRLDDDRDRKEMEKHLAFFEALEMPFPESIWSKLEASADDKFQNTLVEMDSLWLRLLGNALEKQDVMQVMKLAFKPFMYYKTEEIGNQTLSNVVISLKFLGKEEVAQKLVFETLVNLPELSGNL